MRKVMCPACTREVARSFIRYGTFPCPLCKASLRTPQSSRLVTVPLVACGWLLGFLIPYWIGLQGNELFAVGLVLSLLLSFGFVSLLAGLEAYLFPRLERDLGEILHVVPGPGP
jgi:hypothetical protein